MTLHDPARSLRCAALWLLGSVLPLYSQLPGQAPEPVPLPHPEIAPPEVPPAPVSWWLIIVGIGLALALLALVIWLLFLRKAEAEVDTTPPLKKALTRLETLQKEMDTLAPGEVAHQVSVILRDYLQGRYALPAPYRTTEELYGTSSIQARDGLRERFGPVAGLYDRLEFAPQPATQADSLKLMEDAFQVLRDERRHVPGVVPPPLPSSLASVPTPK